MTISCPCCGQPVDSVRDPKLIIDMMVLPDTYRRILEVLAERFGHWVSAETLVDKVYEDRNDGGPLTARRAIDVAMVQIRRRLESTPLYVEGQKGLIGGRRMVWREDFVEKDVA